MNGKLPGRGLNARQLYIVLFGHSALRNGDVMIEFRQNCSRQSLFVREKFHERFRRSRRQTRERAECKVRPLPENSNRSLMGNQRRDVGQVRCAGKLLMRANWRRQVPP